MFRLQLWRGAERTSLSCGPRRAPVGCHFGAQETPWFYLDETGDRQGPILTIELESLLRERSVSITTPVWSKRIGEWQRLGDVPALQSLLP